MYGIPSRWNQDTSSWRKFKEVNEAYAVLSDEEKKQQYDMFGDRKFHQQYSSDDIFRGTDFGSIFDDLGMNGDIFSNIFGGSLAEQGGLEDKVADFIEDLKKVRM